MSDMNERKGPSSIGVGTVNERKFAMFLLTRAVEIPEAVVRFMAGPPMTERERFKQQVTEARIRTDWQRLR